MKINDVTIDALDHIIDMDATFTQLEGKFLITLALNMLYAYEKMYFNMHTGEWELSKEVAAIMERYCNGENKQ